MRFALKMQLTRFLTGGFECYMDRNPYLSLNLIWRYLCDLPSCQIKTTAKYIMYIRVYYCCVIVEMLYLNNVH